MRTAHEFALEGFAFPTAMWRCSTSQWSWRNAPYVVAQNTGAFLEIPSMLDEQHTCRRARMRTLICTLEAYAGQLDGETGRLQSAASQNVIAPDFLLDKTLSQIKLARGGEVAQWSLVTSLAKRAKDMPAWRTVQRRSRRQMSRPRSTARLPSSKFTAARDRRCRVSGNCRAAMSTTRGVAAGTTTRMTPDEIHQRGREELRALQSEMDAILKEQGLTNGTVGERMTALGKDARFKFEDSDAGRAKLMAFLNARVADMRKRLPRAFATLVPGYFEIKRMAPEVEPGAPALTAGPAPSTARCPENSGSTCTR
jgi:uncharacterized protein (DUF885 family)